MDKRSTGRRKNGRKQSGKPPRWLVLGALAASAGLGGRIASATQPLPGGSNKVSPYESALLAVRRLPVPPGFAERTPVTLLEEGWTLAWLGAPGSDTADIADTADTVDDAAAVPQLRRRAPERETPARRFDIPPGPLSAALVAFSEATGLRMAVPNGLAGFESPGVAGLFSAGQALRELLAGTGITFRFTGEDAVELELPMVSETIEVTTTPGPSSPKYTEPLRDTPQTLTVIPHQMIEQQGATTLRDVLRNVTGISIQAGEGGGGLPGDNLAIRGFAARNDIFVDGVRDFGAYSRDPFNIETVEVAKGPASLYGGRGSTGGSLNIISKRPHLAEARFGNLSGGNEEFGRATVDMNQPLAGIEGAAVRVNGMWNQADATGRDVVRSERWGVAPSLAFGLGTPTRVTLSYSHLDEDNVPDYGVPWVPPTNVPLAGYADQPPPVDFDNFYGLTGRDYEKTQTGLATAEIQHEWNEAVSLRSLVRHGRSRRDSVITAPRFASTTSTDLNRQLQSRDLTDTILAQQNDLTVLFDTGSLAHSLVTGIEVARETSVNYARTGPTAPLADLFDPSPDDPYTGPITRTGARTESTADTAAAYLTDTVKLNERWQLVGGLRFDRFDVEFESRAVDGVVTPFERTDDLLSWRAGVVHKPCENGSVYVSAGTSFNPGSDGNTGLSLAAGTVDLEPEESRGFEVGTKWDFPQRRISWNAAVFRTEKINARTPGLDPNGPVTVLDGEQRIDGVELGLSGQLTDRFTAFFGYTFLDSEIVASNNAAEVGNEFGNAPDHSVSLWTTFRVTGAFELGAGVQYVGDRFNNNTATRVAPDYTLVDFMASYRVSDLFTLRLNATNLADEDYIDRVGGGHFIPGAGRSVALTTALGF
jgi:catecholate siderophore receptor